MQSLKDYYLIHRDPELEGALFIGHVVTHAVEAGYILVRYETNNAGHPPVTPMRVEPLEHLTYVTDSGSPMYEFFETRDAAIAWADWLAGEPTDEEAAAAARPN